MKRGESCRHCRVRLFPLYCFDRQVRTCPSFFHLSFYGNEKRIWNLVRGTRKKNTHQSKKEAELIRHSLAEKTLPFLTLVLKKGFSPFYSFCFCTDESHSDIDQIGGWWAKKGGNSFMEKSLLIDQEPAGGAKKRSDWPPTAWKVIEWFVV